jgi:hypothetical protein
MNHPTIGLELEGFSRDLVEDRNTSHGTISRDAGARQIELVTRTCQSAGEAAAAAAQLAYQAGEQVYYRPNVPLVLSHQGVNVWRSDVARYRALLEALRHDCANAGLPETAHNGVLQIADHAALHINLGYDWHTPTVATAMSVVNNLGPLVATALQQHADVPVAAGHLGIWTGWAHPARLPDPAAHRWWAGIHDLEAAYERVARLLKPSLSGEEGDVIPDCTLFSGNLHDPLHQGTMWYFARPKTSPANLRYIELRLYGSSDPHDPAFLRLVEATVEFFRVLLCKAPNGCPASQASDLYSDLRAAGHNWVPEQLATMADWQQSPSWNAQAPCAQTIRVA